MRIIEDQRVLHREGVPEETLVYAVPLLGPLSYGPDKRVILQIMIYLEIRGLQHIKAKVAVTRLVPPEILCLSTGIYQQAGHQHDSCQPESYSQFFFYCSSVHNLPPLQLSS